MRLLAYDSRANLREQLRYRYIKRVFLRFYLFSSFSFFLFNDVVVLISRNVPARPEARGARVPRLIHEDR